MSAVLFAPTPPLLNSFDRLFEIGSRKVGSGIVFIKHSVGRIISIKMNIDLREKCYYLSIKIILMHIFKSIKLDFK